MRPFPYEQWPRVSRSESRLLREVARALPVDDVLGLQRAFESLVGLPIRLRAGELQACSAQHLPGAFGTHVAAVVLLSASDPRHRVAVEIDPRLGSLIVDRILGGHGELGSGGALNDVERGVLAFAATQLLREAPPSAWRVGTVVTSPVALVAALGDEAACWSGHLMIGEHLLSVRLWVPRDVRLPDVGRRIAGLPLTLAVYAGHAVLRSDELRSLRLGDAVLLDECYWREGRVAVRLCSARRTTWWCTRDLYFERLERSLVDASTLGTRSSAGDQTMNDDTTDAMQLIGDAPIELSVELARFTLALEELSRVRPGEVLCSGVRIGERARLCAGDRTIASGELVDIDGEIGFRVIELAP